MIIRTARPKDFLAQAKEFRTIMGQPVGALSIESMTLQISFYVAFQFAAGMGWDLNTALDRVHKSNLSKLVDGKPLRREDGKVLKGPNYAPPTLTDLV